MGSERYHWLRLSLPIGILTVLFVVVLRSIYAVPWLPLGMGALLIPVMFKMFYHIGEAERPSDAPDYDGCLGPLIIIAVSTIAWLSWASGDQDYSAPPMGILLVTLLLAYPVRKVMARLDERGSDRDQDTRLREPDT